MTKREALKRVRSILKGTIAEHGEAIVVTASAEGRPHASWMGTLSSPNIERLLTLTSPDSRKVVNLLENPVVEWLFVNRSRTEVAYLRGIARVVQDPDEVERAWKLLKNKTKAFFMQYMPKQGMGFFVIETKVSEIELVVPKNNLFKVMNPPFRS